MYASPRREATRSVSEQSKTTRTDKKEIKSANVTVLIIENSKQDSENYIYSYFEDIKRQTELRREILKDEIDKYSDELIEKINETKSNYIKLSKEDHEIKSNIENLRKKLSIHLILTKREFMILKIMLLILNLN